MSAPDPVASSQPDAAPQPNVAPVTPTRPTAESSSGPPSASPAPISGGAPLPPTPVLPDPVVTLTEERLRPVSRLLATLFVGSTAATLAGVLLFPGGVQVGVKQFGYSYLVAFMYLSSLLLGSLFWVMIHHLTAAGWSVVLRRLWENNTRALPILLLLSAPVITLIPTLYKWADPNAYQHGVHGTVQVAQDPLWLEKQPWLSPSFFIARLLGYFAIWIYLSTRLADRSQAQDTTGDSSHNIPMSNMSSWGMVLLALTTSFFVFDMMMSLDYHWFSTIYGVYFWAGSINCAMASMVLTVLTLRSFGILKNTITIEHLHDMGKIMFGFTVFWTYIGFSQFFLYWYANIPEETLWYQHRRIGGAFDGNWNSVSWFLFLGRFVIPFFWLLPRSAKRNPTRLAIAAVWIMFMHYVDLYWQIMPNYQNSHDHPSGVDGVHLHWMDVTTWIMAVSLAALFVVARQWPARPLIPTGDSKLNESIHHVNHW